VLRLPGRQRVSEATYLRLLATDPRLLPLRSAAVLCEVDVTVAHASARRGWAQVHSRQGLLGDRVAIASSAGSAVELAWLGAEHWQTELARAATVPVPARAPAPPEDRVEVPLDVLLGAAEALRTRRADVLDELAARAGSDDPSGLRDQLVRLHTAVVGRLLATVAASNDGTSRAGWVSWLLFGDGWRSLTPLRRDGRPVVLLAPTEPLDLGRQVAALVTLVGGRS
jgi:hypothetical protein